jgi:hypothetical protein
MSKVKVLYDLHFRLNETRKSYEYVDIFLIQIALKFPVTQLDVGSEIWHDVRSIRSV